MVKESIRTALRNFGLTEKEIDVYLTLARRGVQKTGQIAKQLKMNKGLIYRLLKNLQKKGVVEVTFESPTRYTAIPFEKVIDSYVKSKREEAERIEDAKDSLLSEWKRISQEEIDSSLEKFGVIEGKKKIYKKISQMVKETEKQVTIGLLVSDLIDAERFEVFDVADDVINYGNNFRILTQLSKQNLKSLKIIKNRIKLGWNFRGINPNLELSSFSRMVIKDNDEIVLFISDNQSGPPINQTEVCLFTNCKSIIQAFSIFFEDLWKNSVKIEEGIQQIETGKAIPEMLLLKDPITSMKKFEDVLENAKNEILIVSSSEGLPVFENMLQKFWINKDRKFSIKIMVPIIEKNLEIAKNLLNFCEVKHISSSYNETVIIDSKDLFQFKNSKLEQVSDTLHFFKNTLYTNEIDYIEKTKNMLDDLWLKATIPSKKTIESVIIPTETNMDAKGLGKSVLKNFRKVLTFEIEKQQGPKSLTESDVLNKILKAKNSETKYFKNGLRQYASTGQAIIHPPSFFNLPDIMFHAFHFDEPSTNGNGDSLVVFLWLDTKDGSGFVPVGTVTNNPNSLETEKRIFKGTPAEYNQNLFKKDEFYVRVHGNTLFAAWTKKIPLFPPPLELPPSCLLLEGIGDAKTGRLALAYQSGFKNKIEFNAFEALVTFFHPSSKYSGPGTDGILFRDYVGEAFIG